MVQSKILLIENELNQLCIEVKKKNKQNSQQIDICISILENIKTDKEIDEEQFMSILLQQLLITSDSKNQKIIQLSLGIFQKLITFEIIKQLQIMIVFEYLFRILDIQDENLNIRILQTLLLIINPKIIVFENLSFIEKMYHLSLMMINSKNPLIHNTSSAALQQLTTIIFEQFVQEFNQIADQNGQMNSLEYEEFQKNPIYQNILKITQDFVNIAVGKPSNWAFSQQYKDISQIGFDLINLILKQCGKQLDQLPDLSELFSQHLTPLIQKSISSISQQSFIAILRNVRAFTRLMIIGYELIDDYLILFQNSQVNNIKVYLALEGLILLFKDPNFLMNCFKTSRQKNSFQNMLNELYNICKDLVIQGSEEITKNQLQQQKFVKCVSSNHVEIDVPVVTYNIIFKMLIEALCSISDNCLLYLDKLNIQIGTRISNQQVDLTDHNLITQMSDESSKQCLKCFKHLLSIEADETYNHTMLNSMQNWIKITGTLELEQNRDAFLRTLCNFCIPNEISEDLSQKHVDTSNVLFNIAHCLGDIMDQNSWHIILNTLQKLENLYTRFQKKKIESPINGINDIKSDFQILSSAMNSLFLQSNHYQDKHLLCLLNGLNSITIDYLEKITISEQSQGNQETIDQLKIGAFGLFKMQETVLANLYRIDIIWDLIVAHFLVISNQKKIQSRKLAVETLSNCILQIFCYIKNEIEMNTDNRLFKIEKWSPQNAEVTIFTPWKNLINGNFNESKNIIIQTMYNLIQNNGHQVSNDGWKEILFIISQVSQDQEQTYSFIAFKCLELLVNQYLNELESSNLYTLLNNIEYFKQNLKNNNIHYQSVGLLWNIGDYIVKLKSDSKINTQQFEDLLYNLLSKIMSLCLDYSSEVRHSALHVLYQVLLHHGQHLTQNAWGIIFDNILFNVGEKLMKFFLKMFPQQILNDLQQNDQITDEEFKNMDSQKSWESTFILYIQQFTKIVMKYISYFKNIKLDESCRKSLQKIGMFLQINKLEIFIESVKSFSEIVQDQGQNLLQHVNQIQEILKNILSRVKNFQTQDLKEIKFFIGKIIPVIFYLCQNYLMQAGKIFDDQDQLFCQNFNLTLQIVDSSLLSAEQAEQFNSSNPFKLFIDEKPCYDFINSWASIIQQESSEFQKQFVQFVIKLFEKEICQKNYELYISYILQILPQFLKNTHQNIVNDMDKPLLVQINKLIDQKENYNYQQYYFNESKLNQPIWLFAAESLTQLSKTISTNVIYIQNKKQVQTLFKIQSQDSQKILNYQNFLIQVEVQLISLAVDQLLEEQTKMDEKSINDILIFLQQNCLPIEADQNAILDESQKKDMLLRFFNPELIISSRFFFNEIISPKIAKLYFDQLFRLSSDAVKSNKMVTQKCLPILLKRCSKIIVHFMNQEKIYGKTLQKWKIQEMQYVLESLLKLNIPSNSLQYCFDSNDKTKFENQLYQGNKAHLFYLMPIFNKCITSLEQEFKHTLMSIYQLISSIQGLE